MSFRRNVAANYASQIYVTLAGIAIVPLYLKYMGAEAYGLVGIFAMLQAWFGLLDVGLSPTLARESARSRAGAVSAIDFRRLVRALTIVFIVVAVVGSASLFVSASYLSDRWLRVEQMPPATVIRSVQLMAAGIGLRWLSGLARARIVGSESIVWLSVFNSLVATVRFGGVIPVFILIDTDPDTFFAFQLIVAAVELLVLTWHAHRLLPALEAGHRIGWSLRPIRPVLKFSLAIALTSSIWVLVTQTDKLVLSKLLSLQDYGYYSLAVVIAGSVLILSGPISLALIPRLTNLAAQGEQRELLKIYRFATRIVSAIAFPVGFVLAAFAGPVVWSWTGDQTAAEIIAPNLQLYAIGNAILAVSAFPAFLQYAHGNIRLHMIGSVLFALVLLPAIMFGVWKYGAIGAGWAWLITNLLYLVFWVPLVHKRFAPGLHRRWLTNDVLAGLAIAGFGAVAARYSLDLSEVSRVRAGLIPVCAGMAVLIVTVVPLLGKEIVGSLKRRFAT